MEAVEQALDCIERWQPVTNAFSQVFGEEAREEATRGVSGPLAGVPVAVKDLFDVAGHETSGCSAAYRGSIAAHRSRKCWSTKQNGSLTVLQSC